MTMTEQSAKLAELQGANEIARTGKPRSRSPAADARLSAHYISASRHNVPQFHGVKADDLMWRNKLLSHLSLFNYRKAVAPRAVPILVSNDNIMRSELRRRHSVREID